MTDWLQAISELQLPPLRVGKHDTAAVGLCAMEMVAFMERLPHSDSPACTCPVIAAYVRSLNDRLPDLQRPRLLPYLPRLVGTVSPAHELARAEYLAWQAIRVFAPLALRAAGLGEQAKTLVVCVDLRSAARWATEAATAARVAGAAGLAARVAEAARAARAVMAAGLAARAVTAATGGLREIRSATAAEEAAHAAGAAGAVAASFRALDGVLAIGPPARAFTSLAALSELVALA